jgi:nucleotide-binding universal stress UspA family protein
LLHVNTLATSLPLDKYSQTAAITQKDIVNLIASTREAGFTILEQAQQQVERAGIPVKTLFREEPIVQTIINAAKDGNSDLIILGAHGIQPRDRASAWKRQ